MVRFVAGLVCLLVVASSHAVEDQEADQSELAGFMASEALTQEYGDCKTEVKMAKAKCAAGKAQLKEIVGSSCGSKHLKTIMSTIKTNHEKAQRTQTDLLQAERTLSMLVSHSSSTISREQRSESVLLHQMTVLKSSQLQLENEKRAAKTSETDEHSLLRKAKQATEDAVKHAKSSDDLGTTKGLRDKASDLFEQYVHKRVHLATLQRKATVSNDGVTKMNTAVLQKKTEAQAAMRAKKKALEEIASAKSKVASLTKKVAGEEVDAAKLEVKASEEEKKVLETKMESSKKVQRDAAKSLEKSQAKAQKIHQLASAATKMVKETEDMSLKALLAQTEDMGLDDPIKRY
jgi:hypothetical protein